MPLSILANTRYLSPAPAASVRPHYHFWARHVTRYNVHIMRGTFSPKLAKSDVSHGKYLVIMRLPWGINTCDSAKQRVLFYKNFPVCLNIICSFLIKTLSSYWYYIKLQASYWLLCFIMEASQAKTFQKLNLKHLEINR